MYQKSKFLKLQKKDGIIKNLNLNLKQGLFISMIKSFIFYLKI